MYTGERVEPSRHGMQVCQGVLYLTRIDAALSSHYVGCQQR